MIEIKVRKEDIPPDSCLPVSVRARKSKIIIYVVVCVTCLGNRNKMSIDVITILALCIMGTSLDVMTVYWLTGLFLPGCASPKLSTCLSVSLPVCISL